MTSSTIMARQRDLGGGLIVRRVLPSMVRRMVGPFIFVDHMGPIHMESGHGMDVRPHPHINLATVTYLFDGEIVHRDTLGSEQLIRPGEVNWMTAGRGIAHSERTPSEARKSGASMHGLQTWVALPKEHEETAPMFRHYSGKDIPTVGRDGVRMNVIAGSAYGVTSPVETLSPLFYVDVQLDAGATVELPDYPDRAAYVVSGSVEVEGEQHGEVSLIVGAPQLRATSDAHVMLLGGDKLEGERHIWWNFVSSSPERIEEAKRDWSEERFGNIPGDDKERIPLPER